MNVLSDSARLCVLAALVEGNSLRATERLARVGRKAITDLLVDVGEGCLHVHDTLMRGLPCAVLELDEIWTFVGKKQGRVRDDDPKDWGDQYTFTALDAVTKLVPSFRVGRRDVPNTQAFAMDLRARVVGAPQITTDGFIPYVEAIESAFGSRVHYAQVLKTYRGDEAGGASRDDVRYGRGRVVRSVKRVVQGTPDPDLISTSYVERNNLTTRMQGRRFTRLTNAYSKKLANLIAAVALHFTHYNLVRVHETLRVTPAMQAGLTDHVWSIAELLDAAMTTEAPEPLPVPVPPLARVTARASRPTGEVPVLPGQLALPGLDGQMLLPGVT